MFLVDMKIRSKQILACIIVHICNTNTKDYQMPAERLFAMLKQGVSKCRPNAYGNAEMQNRPPTHLFISACHCDSRTVHVTYNTKRTTTPTAPNTPPAHSPILPAPLPAALVAAGGLVLGAVVFPVVVDIVFDEVAVPLAELAPEPALALPPLDNPVGAGNMPEW